MKGADIEPLGEGRYLVTGVLDATTVGPVLKRSALLFADSPTLHIDMAGVTESDSSGLALLIEWLRLAKQKRQQISFHNMPHQVDALARISEVEELFHGNGTTVAAPHAVAAAQ